MTRKKTNLDGINELIAEKITGKYLVEKFGDKIPDYCGNLQLAWTVAEKVDLFCEYTIMEADSLWWAIKTAAINPSHQKPGSDFFVDVNDRLEIIAMGKTPAETLCRAALVIKGREIEQASKANQSDHPRTTSSSPFQ